MNYKTNVKSIDKTGNSLANQSKITTTTKKER